MASNILIAIKNLIENPIISIKSYYFGRNRVNGVGNALEKYVKDSHLVDYKKELMTHILNEKINTILEPIGYIKEITILKFMATRV